MYLFSIHGLKYIGNGNNLCEKLAWFCVIMFQFSLAAFLTLKVFNTWSESPVVTVSDLVPAEEVDFPSVTLCPSGT